MTDQLPASVRSAERMKFFTDAVVAIAMTLLILPLLEAVTEAASEGLDTAGFLREHDGQLISFFISFAIIANFWVGHNRFFETVEKYDGRLVWLNVLWMLTIVWLPVPTALSGQMSTDRLQITLYVGTMLASSVVMMLMQIAVRTHPSLWNEEHPPTTAGLAASITVCALFALALALALAIPDVGYFALLILMLTALLQPLVARMLGRGAHRD